MIKLLILRWYDASIMLLIEIVIIYALAVAHDI